MSGAQIAPTTVIPKITIKMNKTIFGLVQIMGYLFSINQIILFRNFQVILKT